jgi:hypothetical protein
MGQNLVAIFELDPKHGVRKGLGDCAFKHNRIVLWLWQNVLLRRRTQRVQMFQLGTASLQVQPKFTVARPLYKRCLSSKPDGLLIEGVLHPVQTGRNSVAATFPAPERV